MRASSQLDRKVISVMANRRAAAALTQEEFAHQVNAHLVDDRAWTRATVSSLEVGRRSSLGLDELAAVCMVLDITLFELLRSAGADTQTMQYLTGR